MLVRLFLVCAVVAYWTFFPPRRFALSMMLRIPVLYSWYSAIGNLAIPNHTQSEDDMTILQRVTTTCHTQLDNIRQEAQKYGLAGNTTTIRSFGHRLISDENGQDLIEYALIAAIIAIGAVASLRALQNYVSQAFDSIGSNLNSAVGG